MTKQNNKLFTDAGYGSIRRKAQAIIIFVLGITAPSLGAYFFVQK